MSVLFTYMCSYYKICKTEEGCKMPETLPKKNYFNRDIAKLYWQTGVYDVCFDDESGKIKPKATVGNLRILLVEDNKLIQKINLDILEGAEFVVDAAADYDESMDLYKKHKYDVILLDLGLPGKSGIDLCCDIRRIEFQNKAHTPILALTAYGESAAEDSYQAGADDFAVKPLLQEDLLDFVVKWLPADDKS